MPLSGKRADRSPAQGNPSAGQEGNRDFMTSCHIAVCDDQKSDREYVERLVRKWAEAAGIPVRVETFPSAESFLFRYEEDKRCDILILDVEMGSMDGVSLARMIRRENETIQILFLTGYSDYIAEGYEVAALHYLVKPVKEEKLFSVLDRALDKVRKNETVLNLTSGGELVRIPIHQLRYADVMGNYVTLHAREDCTVKMTLGELEKQLDERFYRAGRSVLVNLTYISRVTKTEIRLSDGTAIPLPRGAYEGVNRAIIQMR